MPTDDTTAPDPTTAPGDAAEAAGIVDQQAVAVQAVREQEREDEEGGDGTASDPDREAEQPTPPGEPGGPAPS